MWAAGQCQREWLAQHFGKYRLAVLVGCLSMARGRVQRAGEIVHLVAAHLEDLTHWLNLLRPDEGARG